MTNYIVSTGPGGRGWVAEYYVFAEEAEALNQACSLLAMGKRVHIETEDGRLVSGETLTACCRGEKDLAALLK